MRRLRRRIGEATGERHAMARAVRRTRADRLGDRIGGDCQDDEIGRLRQVGNPGETLHAVHTSPVRIDDPDLAGKAEAHEVLHRIATEITGAAGCADHRDRLWIQQTGDVDEVRHRPRW